MDLSNENQYLMKMKSFIDESILMNRLKFPDIEEVFEYDPNNFELVQNIAITRNTVKEFRFVSKGFSKSLAIKTIKIPYRRDITNASFGLRLVNEVKTLSIVSNHPNIVDFYGLSFADSQLKIFMEIMDMSLSDLYSMVHEKNEIFPERIVGCITVATVDALNFCKALNYIHRDVKPHNILVNRKGDIKLCDFGESRMLQNSLASTMVGTIAYMPPERFDHNFENYDVRTDIWSLGITLTEVVYGALPFGERNNKLHEIMQCIKIFDPQIMIENCVRETYSNDFKEFLLSCLQKVEKRPKYDALMKLKFYLTHQAIKQETYQVMKVFIRNIDNHDHGDDDDDDDKKKKETDDNKKDFHSHDNSTPAKLPDPSQGRIYEDPNVPNVENESKIQRPIEGERKCCANQPCNCVTNFFNNKVQKINSCKTMDEVTNTMNEITISMLTDFHLNPTSSKSITHETKPIGNKAATSNNSKEAVIGVINYQSISSGYFSFESIKSKNIEKISNMLFFPKSNKVYNVTGIDFIVDKDPLGTGKSSVYLATFIPEDKKIAQKHLYKNFRGRYVTDKQRKKDEEKNKEMMKELEIFLEVSQHANIVDYYGYYEIGYTIIICMELMDCSLLELIKWVHENGTNDKMMLERLMRWTTMAVLDALIFLKEKNVIFRDIKPGNILLNVDGEIKLCDFGESRYLLNSEAKSKVGTALYWPIERFDGNPYTVKSEVWSLGITLLEVAHGFPPHVPDVDRDDLDMFTIKPYIENINVEKLVHDCCGNGYSKDVREFLFSCLKPIDLRPTFSELKTQKFYDKFHINVVMNNAAELVQQMVDWLHKRRDVLKN